MSEMRIGPRTRARIHRWLDSLRTGFWFVPSLMLAIAAAAALGLLYVDERYDPGIKSSIAWAYSGGPEGARSLLSTIAGSMITAASVTFSLAAVALSIASQQYGSRVLRNFMRDRITQILLGTFISTFLYSVLVVRAIRGSEFAGGFVPAIAITVAIVLALISLVMLVFFVHHVSTSIQASHIVSTIADDMRDAIPKLYPSQSGAANRSANVHPPKRTSRLVTVPEGGYLQAINADKLLRLAKEADLFVELLIKPGDHVVDGAEVARAWAVAPIGDDAMDDLADTFTVGPERTPAQDIRFQFQQLTDVIVRALSPGINDPFTAMNGIDELATALTLVARRARVAEEREDDQGTLRLLVPAPRITELVRDTVGHIAIYGAGDPFVVERLRTVLALVEPSLRDDSERSLVLAVREDLARRARAKRVD